MKHLALSILALSTLAACAPRQTESSSASSTYGSRERTFNPQTKEWEWQKPGASTGPGAQTAPYYR